MNSKELIAALKSRGEEVLYKIADEYSAYICTVMRNFAGSAGISAPPEDVEALCVDVLFAVWEHRENLDENVGLKPYLSVSAKNAVRNYLRSKSRKECDSLDELSQETEFASDLSIERTAELNEMMSALNEELDSLTKEERDIFLRRFFFGESYAMIADSLGLQEGTVRVRLSRTRAKLKKNLQQRGFDYV